MSAQTLSQRQVQTLRLSPQQILYAKLLQLPAMQLEQRVKQEIEENPMLEEALDGDLEIDEEDDSPRDETQPEPNALEEAMRQSAEPTQPVSTDA
ncbi:MAG: hypothetical protein RMM16_05245, partial [Chloroherpetonaceae bacterium]|nr:hypothetical protein [Chloroherpetonaceae bacterium]